MGERAPRWYDEPRWYYVGNGQRRYRDSSGWTDRYQDIDSPAQSQEVQAPAPAPAPRPPVAGAGPLRAARRFWSAVTREDLGVRASRRIRPVRWGGSGERTESGCTESRRTESGRTGSSQPYGPASLAPESLSPEWRAALRVGAGHPVLPGVRFTTHGTLTLGASWVGSGECGCAGSDGYDDLTAGARVKITGAGGRALALGQLGPGEYAPGADDSAIGTCVFTFTVDNTPGGEDLYVVMVEGHTWPQLTDAEMRAGPSLFVGDQTSTGLAAS